MTSSKDKTAATGPPMPSRADLYENAPDMFASIAADSGKIVRCNQTLAAALGYTREEILALDHISELYHPESEEVRKGVFEAFLQTGEVKDVDLLLKRKDASKLDVSLSLSSVVDENGKILYSRSVWRDVTKRKRAEEGLRELTATLERRVRERTENLEKANLELRKEVELRRQAEKDLEDSLAVKDRLFKEVHHRVKNNLQIISSLLFLQGRNPAGKEPQELFAATRRRIESMSLVHELLHQSDDLDRVGAGRYFKQLVAGLAEYQGAKVAMEVVADDVSLETERAIPCGLIVNELVVNCLKHAFPDAESGRIRLSFRSPRKDRFVLVVEDDGRGLPADLDPATSETLGLKLVVTLVEQLEGRLEIQRGPGARFEIRFPDE